jgi:hypothetical protein
MLVKFNKSRSKKKRVSDAQVHEAWRNDMCLCQAVERYREFSKLTVDEQVDRIFEYPLGDFPVPINAVIMRAAEVYRDVTGRSPRTVGTEARTGPPLGENPFIALITTLLEEEGLRSPSGYVITRVLRKKSIKRGEGIDNQSIKRGRV